jgi:NAD(P)H-hydrate epimerase
VIPILTTAQMRAADAKSVAARGTDALVRLAGTAVALEAQRLLVTCYGKRVAVVAGPGLNGADGRVAAAWLKGRGCHVDVIDVAHQPAELAGYDLVIDAAFGLGCSRPYAAPRVTPRTPVLAVDLPSGVDADTGAVLGEPPRATVTVALGAIKPAHLNGPSAAFTGDLHFAGLGIVTEFQDGLIDDGDLATFLEGAPNDHKWVHALQAYVGSPSMPGAAALVTRGAIAGGASMIRLSPRGDLAGRADLPAEVVHVPDGDFDRRCRAVVAGPGVGAEGRPWLAERLAGVTAPVVLDADGLADEVLAAHRGADGPWILTPHDGEFARLSGASVPGDRFSAVRDLARALGHIVLLKGPTTVIASPDGTLRVVTSGTSALATAGSGDVLSGLIGATLARGHDPLDAASLAAHLHGRAGAHLAPYAPASALPGEITRLLSGLAC